MRGFWSFSIILPALGFCLNALGSFVEFEGSENLICGLRLAGSLRDILAEERSEIESLPTPTLGWWSNHKLAVNLKQSVRLLQWHHSCLDKFPQATCDRVAIDFPSMTEFNARELELFESFLSNPIVQKLWQALPGPVVISSNTLTPVDPLGRVWREEHGSCKKRKPYNIMVSLFRDDARAHIFIHEMAHRFWFGWFQKRAPDLVGRVENLWFQQKKAGANRSKVFRDQTWHSVDEYWAYGVGALFYQGPTLFDGGNVYMVPRSTLRQFDPEFFDVLYDLFSPSELGAASQ